MKRMVFLLMLFGLFLPVYAQEFSAVIRELHGRVEIQAPGGSAWVPASVGMAIEKNTRISTGFKASALITVGESLVTVRPLTRLTLEEITRLGEQDRAGLYLETGRVRAEVTPPKGGKIDFSVRSPVVTASVRGTVFEIDTVNLRVLEGRIQYASPAGSFAWVRAGEKSAASERTGVVSTPRAEGSRTFAPALPPSTETGSRVAAAGNSVSVPASASEPTPETPGNPKPPANPGGSGGGYYNPPPPMGKIDVDVTL
jgi:hypothetical protein